jgi:hypothetical protein
VGSPGAGRLVSFQRRLRVARQLERLVATIESAAGAAAAVLETACVMVVVPPLEIMPQRIDTTRRPRGSKGGRDWTRT